MILSNHDPFSTKSWQEFLNQTNFLSAYGLTVEDVKKAIDEWQKENARQLEERGKQVVKTPKCPECGYHLYLLPVNISAETKTGDDSKCVWICRKCHYNKYSARTIIEELKETK